jgi:hypothetical protein
MERYINGRVAGDGLPLDLKQHTVLGNDGEQTGA